MHQAKQNGQPQISSFRVRVGHTSITVRARSWQDAVREARTRLSLEMPRMWDVIQSLDASQFQVVPLDLKEPPDSGRNRNGHR